MDILKSLSEELSLPLKGVEAAVRLLDEGNTVPFIARYRKEATGSLDDTALRALADRLAYRRALEARREEVRGLIEAAGALTPEIVRALDAANTLTEIDDVYRPFRPHRRTRASIAREKGLEDLALLLLMQEEVYQPSLEEAAAAFICEEKGVATAEEALAGACDIIAEDISDNAVYRREIRRLTAAYGTLAVRAVKPETDSVYRLYYDFSESVGRLPGHRVLAINRGEKEGILSVKLVIDDAIPLNYLYGEVVRPSSPAARYVTSAAVDAYGRLIAPSVEREIRNDLTDRAGESAIRLFSDNLKHLLMQPPIRGKTVLGLDPGYRTGCKLAVVDPTGRVLETAVIYPTKPHERIDEAKKTVKALIRRHGINAVAIGNGTASKESEQFIASVIREIPEDVKYMMVSEAGASVYSASPLAADEFPDFDVTERSAVSIARRMQDPLAELVKIEPRAIGVGQYQHDMKPARLEEALTGVVEDCVNSVGVDVNTASHSLLSYIAGINAATAKNIVKYRESHGAFRSRAELKQVPRIGDRAYEQCAGFLRVSGSDEILDRTGVHPESYPAARALLRTFGYRDDDVRGRRLGGLREKIAARGIGRVCEELAVGQPTLEDIVTELEKPERDVRDELPPPILRDDVLDMESLKPDMVLKGTVRNVVDFGAFVDIGVHQDGLVHLSRIADHYIRHPSEVLSVGDIVTVKVVEVDLQKKRIALSMLL